MAENVTEFKKGQTGASVSQASDDNETATRIIGIFPETANNIDNAHNEYKRNAWNWLTVRDSIEGESCIKSRNELYLPMPSSMPMAKPVQGPNWSFYDQNLDSLAKTMDRAYMPNYHPNVAYAAYLQRSQFPELTSYMLRGLMGLVTKDRPLVELTPSLEHLVENATPSGMGLIELFNYCVSEVLTNGRFPLVTNIGPNGKFTLVPYVAKNFINWRTSRPIASQHNSATMCVFKEVVDTPSNMFDDETENEYAVLAMSDGVYAAGRYNEKGSFLGATIPNYMGKPLHYIPITCFGSVNDRFNVDPSPLYSVASTSLHIYMRNADLSQSEFMSCNPTLFLSGVTDDEAPAALGSTVGVCLSNDNAKAYYTQTDTSALSHVLSHIGDLYEQAIYYGAQLLDSSKKAAESAETVRLKTASTGATLSSMVKSIGHAFEKHLKNAAEWAGEDSDNVKFVPLTDFMAPAVTAQEQRALVESWLDGAISKISLLENFSRAGMLPEGVSAEDEISRIEEELENSGTRPQPQTNETQPTE